MQGVLGQVRASFDASKSINQLHIFMDIGIHYERQTKNFVNKGEKSISYKHRLGHKAAKMRQSVFITGLPERINTKWKKELTNKLRTCDNEFRHDTKAIIRTPYGSFQITVRDIRTFSNNIANCILLTIKKRDGRDEIDNANPRSLK
jgi:hypothetical protein